MKCDLDRFNRELFYGFSTFVITHPDSERAIAYSQAFNEMKKNNRNILEEMLILFEKYRKNELNDDQIIKLYNTIVRFRTFGIIIHEQTAVSTLKMEKLYAEEKSQRLVKENELLAEELSRCRSSLDSKKAAMDAIK